MEMKDESPQKRPRSPRYALRSLAGKRARDATDDHDAISGHSPKRQRTASTSTSQPTKSRTTRRETSNLKKSPNPDPSIPPTASPPPETTTTHPQPTPSAFLTRLPREVRDIIYQYALYNPSGFSYQDALFTDSTRHASYLSLSRTPPFHPEPCRLASRLNPALLYTCRQIRAEALDIPLKVNTVHFQFRWATLLAPMSPPATPPPLDPSGPNADADDETNAAAEVAERPAPESAPSMLWPYDSLTRYMLFKPRPYFLSTLRHLTFHYAAPILEFIAFDLVYHLSSLPDQPAAVPLQHPPLQQPPHPPPPSPFESSKSHFPADIHSILSLPTHSPKLQIAILIDGWDTDPALIPPSYTHTLYTLLKMLEMVLTPLRASFPYIPTPTPTAAPSPKGDANLTSSANGSYSSSLSSLHSSPPPPPPPAPPPSSFSSSSATKAPIRLLFDGRAGGGSVVQVLPHPAFRGVRWIPRGYLELHGTRTAWIEAVVGRVLGEWPQFQGLRRECVECEGFGEAL